MEKTTLSINGIRSRHGVMIEVTSELRLDAKGVEALLRERLKAQDKSTAVEIIDKYALNGSRFLVLSHPDIGIDPVVGILHTICNEIRTVLNRDVLLGVLKTEDESDDGS